MDRFRADLRQLDRLNIAKQGVPIPAAGRPMRRLSEEEKSLLRSTVAFGEGIYRPMALVGDLMTVADKPAVVEVLAPSSIPVGMLTTPLGPRVYRGPITGGLGLEHSAAAFLGFSVQAGFYASTTREIGVFVSGSGGFWSNTSVALGPTVTIIFGPPLGLHWCFVGDRS